MRDPVSKSCTYLKAIAERERERPRHTDTERETTAAE